MSFNHPHSIRVNRAIDLGAIEAVGFDLDHTLALYDDAAVNELAATAARRLLVEQLDYPRWLVERPAPMDAPAAARTLAADLGQGAVVKLDAERRVVRARLGGQWLDEAERDHRYPQSLSDDRRAVYAVHSPFELPVLWLLEEMEARVPDTPARAARCEDIRRMLDAAHTNGALKMRLREDLGRYVSAIEGVAAGLERWAASGKRLFVVTNSEPDFAPAVLDIAVGPAWRGLFQLVVADARKPAFFRPAALSGSRTRAQPRRDALVIEGGSAADVEEMLGVPCDRILFVGDNAQSDILAARGHGWRTAHVVPELAVTESACRDGWGAPLTHGGEPTWLARIARDHADIACPHAGQFLALEPSARLAPAATVPVSPESP